MPILQLKRGGETLGSYTLKPGMRITIGRNEDNDIVLDDPAVSVKHAEIEPEGNHFYITDFNSKNGTFVNKELVISRRLGDGDEITIGSHTIVFTYGKEEEPPPSCGHERMQATMHIDTPDHRAKIAKSMARIAVQEPERQIRKVKGVLTFLDGIKDPVVIDGDGVMIGRDSSCKIKLKGWFAPKQAARVVKENDAYVIHPIAGRVKLNYAPLKKKSVLNEFDVIEVGSCQMQFQYIEDSGVDNAKK